MLDLKDTRVTCRQPTLFPSQTAHKHVLVSNMLIYNNRNNVLNTVEESLRAHLFWIHLCWFQCLKVRRTLSCTRLENEQAKPRPLVGRASELANERALLKEAEAEIYHDVIST